VSIRKRGPRSYQVRVGPFVQTVPTKAAAEKLELDFKLRRVGDLERVSPTTLGDEIDRLPGAASGVRRAAAAQHRVLRTEAKG
jgi:hypothetical protein